ncbi:S49 family peptidase [Escherichia coli]|nr:S49 family peptidase [Escherichia coli]
MAFNEPLLLEPAYARVFFCALGKEMGAGSLAVPQQAVQLDADGMQLAVTDYMAGGQRPAKSYQVKNGIAILPVSGTLVHKLGTLRPYSGMTGYDGLTARLQMAVNDPDVRGILLDIDSPGGQAAGAFDCADMIYRLREQKPVWALCNDMACSAAMLLAAACTRRLVTQTAKIGSIGVMMAHTSYEKQLAQEGVDITLIYSGQHKVDGNSIQALPAGVRADFQRRIDEARRMFVDKVSLYTGLSSEAVMNTEAAVYDGQAGIDAGLADQLINAADAVEVMVSAINKEINREVNMSQTNVSIIEAVAQENQRVMEILNCQEAKGREQLAQMLAGQPGMTVEQAKAFLAAVPAASVANTGDQIMGLPEAKGREQLAQMLAGQPGMTVEQAKAFLAAAPAAGTGDQIMGLPEAKGREQLAQMLAGQPGMTVEQAKAFLAAAPAAGTGDQIMALPEAKGREQLAQTLAEQPGMTVDQAKTLLAAAPVAGSASVGDQIMALPEAKGREQLAQALTEQPGMTVAQAKTLLAAAPVASQPSQETLFDRFMAQHAASAVSGGGTAGRGEEDLLMSMP